MPSYGIIVCLHLFIFTWIIPIFHLPGFDIRPKNLTQVIVAIIIINIKTFYSCSNVIVQPFLYVWCFIFCNSYCC